MWAALRLPAVLQLPSSADCTAAADRCRLMRTCHVKRRAAAQKQQGSAVHSLRRHAVYTTCCCLLGSRPAKQHSTAQHRRHSTAPRSDYSTEGAKREEGSRAATRASANHLIHMAYTADCCHVCCCGAQHSQDCHDMSLPAPQLWCTVAALYRSQGTDSKCPSPPLLLWHIAAALYSCCGVHHSNGRNYCPAPHSPKAPLPATQQQDSLPIICSKKPPCSGAAC
jgi:hypothetical protein